jgi:aspartyl-tRNA(Asn)/glutamyl-tRNA(Gln) amidotransferase subunit C
MPLTQEDVLQIAHLARLSIEPSGVSSVADRLNNILKMVEQMSAVNTQGIEPFAHPLQMTQPLREDQVTESDQREACQAIAPLTESGLYLVPAVIE